MVGDLLQTESNVGTITPAYLGAICWRDIDYNVYSIAHLLGQCAGRP